jgi:hypothetical protein
MIFGGYLASIQGKKRFFFNEAFKNIKMLAIVHIPFFEIPHKE